MRTAAAATTALCLFLVQGEALGASPTGTQAAPSGPCAPPALGDRGTGEGRNDPLRVPESVGELRVAMLFVDFADHRGSLPPETLYRSYVEDAGVSGWYESVSYGSLRVSVTPVLEWIRLSGTAAASSRRDPRELAAEAAARADALVDFSDVDALYVVPASDLRGAAQVEFFEQPLRLDGGAIRATVWDAVGNMIHELGHVVGLPDLYVRGVAQSFHRWDVMAGMTQSGMLAWHRWKLGWLQESQIACLPRHGRVVATIDPLARPGGTKAVVVRRPGFAVVAEVRSRVGEDARICTTGVLIYRVDLRPRRHYLARPVQIWSARRDETRLLPRCGGLANAPFTTGRKARTVEAFRVRFSLLRRANGAYRIVATSRPPR